MAIPTLAGAQGELEEWLDPTLGRLMPRAEYKLTYRPDEQVHGQLTDFRLLDHGFSLSVPISQDSRSEWSVSGDASYQRVNTRARFPDSHERSPAELWDVSASASYRHKFENDWIGAVSLGVTSPIDCSRPTGSSTTRSG